MYSIRALYGTDGSQNAVHGSDSAGSSEREMKILFGNEVLSKLAFASAVPSRAGSQNELSQQANAE